jgi:hypothetical protein
MNALVTTTNHMTLAHAPNAAQTLMIRKEKQMTDSMAQKIKTIYSRYHAGEITADEAMADLELAINEN